MSEVKRKLDNIVKNEKCTRLQLYLIAVIGVGLVMAGYFAFSSGESTEINGSVKSLHSQSSDGNEQFFIVVMTADSQTLTLEAPRELAVKPGDEVVIHKRKTKLFGMTNYSFSRIKKQ